MGAGAASQSAEINRDHFIFSLPIGYGGFSRVTSAMHIPTKTWLAMKEITITAAQKHARGLEMIRSELDVLMTMGRHEFIVGLHFAFHDMKICYLALDYHSGGDLRYHLQKRHQLTERGVAYIVVCISQALRHLHQRNIIHRDVKPENIVLDEFGHPYLTDFGISWVLDSQESRCFQSSGTRQYLAPEVCTRSHEHGAEADFWSLGVMTYELLFQRRPFDKHCPLEFIEFAESAQMYGIQSTTQYQRARVRSTLHTIHPTEEAGECNKDQEQQILGDAGEDVKKAWHECELDPFIDCDSLTSADKSYKLVCDESHYYFDSDGKLPQHLRVPLPSFSRFYGELSRSCMNALQGLLDIRYWRRLGAGNNFVSLRTNSWFEELNLSWHLIELKKITPPFVPCKSEVSHDLCKKYMSQPNSDNLAVSTSKAGDQANDKDLQEALCGFYYVAEKYTCKVESESPCDDCHPLLSKSEKTCSATAVSFTSSACIV